MLARRVLPDQKVRLADIDPSDTGGIEKEAAKDRTEVLGRELAELQELLFAAGKHGLLIVLQGRDTSGKDGTIVQLSRWLNAQGMSVAPFKVPTPKELAHDFLWRVHGVTPGRGEVTIFNRSHYEDVLVVRVHELAPKEVWSKRYEHINAFERLLVDSSTLIVKFMLHISKEEQEQRLLEREQETEKAWKLSVTDWKEREHWDAYSQAYEDALSRCSPEYAPWHVVPANKKWFRDLVVTEALVEVLRPHRESWMKKLDEMGTVAKAELAAYRQARA